MLARAPWPYRESDALAWLQSPAHPRLPALLVTEPSARGRIVGGCGLHLDQAGEVEVGYWITPDRQGNGFAAEALCGLLRAARVIGHQRLTARCTLDNPASARVLRGAGFRPSDQIATFRSLGRAAEVACAVYALDLREDCLPCPDWTGVQAYAAGIGAAA
jgi:RimJ/RimL family protein N-acetyltransferase